VSTGELASSPAKLATRFCELVGRDPDGLWQAPGRINLIGEHTDYCGGLAMTFALDRRTTVALARRADRRVRCWSAAVPEPSARQFDLDALIPGAGEGWLSYPLGVLWAMGRRGVDVGGLDMVFDSNLPIGGGLASSASLQAALAVAVDEMAGADLPPRSLAELCHQAEADYVGVPTGMLDQMAVLGAAAGHGLLIDFRSLRTEHRPLTLRPLVVVDTGVRHRNADGVYAERRRACEEAATTLGVAQLGDATIETVDAGLRGVAARRARHVVTENSRVTETARRLVTGEDIGPLLFASHRSLRDDFEVSCPELDTVVCVARDLGATGARMTGAGFGGSCIVVGLPGAVLAPAVTAAFAASGYPTIPYVFEVEPSAGPGRLW